MRIGISGPIEDAGRFRSVEGYVGATWVLERPARNSCSENRFVTCTPAQCFAVQEPYARPLAEPEVRHAFMLNSIREVLTVFSPRQLTDEERSNIRIRCMDLLQEEDDVVSKLGWATFPLPAHLLSDQQLQ